MFNRTPMLQAWFHGAPMLRRGMLRRPQCDGIDGGSAATAMTMTSTFVAMLQACFNGPTLRRSKRLYFDS